MIQSLKVPIATRTTIAQNTLEISFDMTGTHFSFSAGQYVTVTLPTLHKLAVKERFRNFSIVSSPLERKRVTIAFRMSDSPFKQEIAKLPIGSIVELKGPAGIFTLPKITITPLFLVAGGVGITPFLSIIRFVHKKRLKYDMTLIYFNRSPSTAPYLRELKSYAPSIKLNAVIGEVTAEAFLPHLVTGRSALWYVAGPPNMVATTKRVLTELGAINNTIKIEEFTT